MKGYHEHKFFEPLYPDAHERGDQEDPCDNCTRQFTEHYNGHCPLPEDEVTGAEQRGSNG